MSKNCNIVFNGDLLEITISDMEIIQIDCSKDVEISPLVNKLIWLIDKQEKIHLNTIPSTDNNKHTVILGVVKNVLEAYNETLTDETENNQQE